MTILGWLAVLTVIYAVVIAGFAVLFRWLRIPARRAVVFGFVAFGVLSGLLMAWVWPLDSLAYCNVYAMLLGDQVYHWAIATLGDPHSADAHHTIPWLLRVPQVYVPVAFVLSGLIGIVVQWVYNRRWRIVR